MNKIILINILLLINLSHLLAQDKKKPEEKTPVYNYVVDDPMDHAFNQYNENNRTFVYIPEFYTYQTTRNNDTTYKCECYDARDSIMNFFALHDFTDVRFVSFFKSYPDNAHPYTDANDGKRKPLPLSSIIRRYDKVGDDKWMSIDYKTNKYTTLKESRTYIVRTDTLTITDPISNKESTTIYCYYKVETIK